MLLGGGCDFDFDWSDVMRKKEYVYNGELFDTPSVGRTKTEEIYCVDWGKKIKDTSAVLDKKLVPQGDDDLLAVMSKGAIWSTLGLPVIIGLMFVDAIFGEVME